MISYLRSLKIPTTVCLSLCLTMPAAAQDPPAFSVAADRMEAEAKIQDERGAPSSFEALALWRNFHEQSNLADRKDSRVPRDIYLHILEEWASQTGPEQVELLAELEYRLAHNARCSKSEQLEIVDYLAKQFPGALLPVTALHSRAWRHALQNGRKIPWSDDADRISRLAKKHVRSLGRSPQARREAAAVLTDFAELVMRAGYVDLLEIARVTLNNAFELVPDYVPALHLRVAIYEQQGSYRKALKDLQQLTRLQPDRADVLLRLAVHYLRLDGAEQAVPILAALMDRPSSDDDLDWVRAVAYQEEIRRRMTAGQWQPARELVRRAQTAYPGLGRFTVLSAAVERHLTGKSSDTTQSLLNAFNGDAGPTPRLLYAQLPDRDMKENRERLLQALKAQNRVLLEGVRQAKLHDFGRAAQCTSLWKGLRPSPSAPSTSVHSVPSSRVPSSRAHSKRAANAKPTGAASGPPILPASEASSDAALASSDAPLASSDATLASSDATLASSDATLASSDATLASSDATLASSDATLASSDAALASSDAPLASSDAALASSEPESQEKGFVYTDGATGETYFVNEVVDLELKQIYVTPSRLGKKGVRLAADQISLLDDGRPQNIVTFEQGEIPFTATLLVDASGSMHGSRLRRALAGGQTFMSQLTALDRARVVVAADRLQGVSSFVSGRADAADHLAVQLQSTRANGGTAIFDHLLLTVDALEPEQGRKVVVLLSDGFDLMSSVSASTVREAVRRSQVQLYWVRLKNLRHPRLTPLTAWRPAAETRKELELLAKTVLESGGDVVEIQNLHQVESAFSNILQDLRNQVAIGYYADPSHGDGRWREVKVKAGGLGVRLRHASGYFDG